MSHGNQSPVAPTIEGPMDISTQIMPANTSTGLPATVGSTLIIQYEGTSTPKLEKLRDGNWFAWKTRMSIVLQRYGVLEVATGSVQKPEDSECAAWNSRDLIAQELIATSIRDEQVIHISECKASAEMWRKLRIVYEPNVGRSAILDKKKLYTAAASEGANIVKHIKEMKRLRNRLSLAGCRIEEDESKLLLASSLPRSWEGFTASLLPYQAISLTSHELVSVLCEEYRRRKERMM